MIPFFVGLTTMFVAWVQVFLGENPMSILSVHWIAHVLITATYLWHLSSQNFRVPSGALHLIEPWRRPGGKWWMLEMADITKHRELNLWMWSWQWCGVFTSPDVWQMSVLKTGGDHQATTNGNCRRLAEGYSATQTIFFLTSETYTFGFKHFSGQNS